MVGSGPPAPASSPNGACEGAIREIGWVWDAPNVASDRAGGDNPDMADTTHAVVAIDSKPSDRVLRIAAVLTGAGLLALSGQEFMHFYIPGKPHVPVTLQTAVVAAMAMGMSRRMSLMSVAIFLLAGAIGLPVFASGESGASVIFGATGGYLVAFLLAQPVVNACAIRAMDARSRMPWLLAGALGAHLVVFGIGVPWLMIVAGMGIEDGLAHGLVPFLPGAVAKTAIATLAGAGLVHWRSQRGW